MFTRLTLGKFCGNGAGRPAQFGTCSTYSV